MPFPHVIYLIANVTLAALAGLIVYRPELAAYLYVARTAECVAAVGVFNVALYWWYAR